MNHDQKRENKTATRIRTAYFRALMASSAILVLSFVVAVQLASNNVAYAQGGCPDEVNPQGRFCGNPHDYEEFGAPPIPSCNSPNAVKNSNVCR